MNRIRNAGAPRVPGRFTSFAAPELSGDSLSETGQAVSDVFVVLNTNVPQSDGLPGIALDISGARTGGTPLIAGTSTTVRIGKLDVSAPTDWQRTTVIIGYGVTTTHGRVSTGTTPLAGGPTGAGGLTQEYATEPVAYTPSFTNVTLGNGTRSAWYTRFGKRVEVWGKFTLGSTSSVTGTFQVDVPYNIDTSINSTNTAVGEWNSFQGGASYCGVARVQSSSALRFTIPSSGSVNNTSPATWASGDTMSWHATYFTDG